MAHIKTCVAKLSLLAYLAAAFGIVTGANSGLAHADSSTILDRIVKQGELRLGYREDAAPFSYVAEGAGPAGYSVDLCLEVAKAIKAKLKLPKLKVAFVPVTADNRFEAVEQGHIDLLCEATTETLTRRKLVDFSIPTFVSGASLLIVQGGPTSFEALAGKKIGVLDGTTTLKDLKATLSDKKITASIVPVKSHGKGFDLLQSGGIAAYFGDRTILEYHLLKANRSNKLVLADNFLSVEPYALAMPHDQGFRLAVDRALSDLYRRGGVLKIFAKSFGEKAKPTNLLSSLYRIASLPN